MIYNHMDKVSLIIRAYNRLEYTIETLDSIISTTSYDNYEIIVVNNNSTDGTKEWLDWVNENSQYYSSKVRAYHMEKNLGDWYGLVEGLKYVSEDSVYVMQVDNDIRLNDREWLNKLVFVMENVPNKMAMLKRTNIDRGYELIPKEGTIRELSYNGEPLRAGDVERPVCCYIMKRDDMDEFVKKYDGIKGSESKYKLLGEFGYTAKLIDVTCFTHINRGKYDHRNKNVREFI